MKLITITEVGTNAAGRIVYRWSCTKCDQHGLWISSIADAEHNGKVHERHVHPAQAVA